MKKILRINLTQWICRFKRFDTWFGLSLFNVNNRDNISLLLSLFFILSVIYNRPCDSMIKIYVPSFKSSTHDTLVVIYILSFSHHYIVFFVCFWRSWDFRKLRFYLVIFKMYKFKVSSWRERNHIRGMEKFNQVFIHFAYIDLHKF